MMIESMVEVTDMNAMIGTMRVETIVMTKIIMIGEGTKEIETTMIEGDTLMI